MPRGFGGYGNPFGVEGPYDANSTQWLQAVDASNSTGLFDIPGYNVSQSWPGQSLDGWTLSVAAVDVSLGGLDDNDLLGLNDYGRMVGYSMTIKAPDALMKPNTDGTKIVDVNNDWGMCFWNWESPDFGNFSLYNNRENKPLAANGSCTGFLSDACIAALENSGATAYDLLDKPTGPYNTRVRCSDFLDTPAECGGTVGGTTFALSSELGVPVQYLNGSVTNQDGWNIDHNTTAQDLKDMWDSMVVNFWPVMTVFIHVQNDTSLLDTQHGLAQLSCIAPDGTGTGKSFTFSDRTGYENGAAYMVHEPLHWVIFITFALTFLFEMW